MANENETVEQVCAEMRSFGNIPPPMFAWRDLAERAEAAHKRELAAKDDERLTVAANYESVIAAKDRIIAAKDAEIARLRAAIKPVLEVKVKDEDDCKGIGRNELTAPCAVCDWWISGCEEDCEVLAVFKAAKECQRIYNEREVSNG